MDSDNLLQNSIISNISDSDLIKDPFSHKFVKDIFPKDFYSEFINTIPSKDLYVPIIDTGTVTKNYSPERYIFNLLDKKERDKLGKEENIFFEQLLKTCLSDKLFTSVTSQFSSTIDNRLSNLSPEEIELFGKSDFSFSIRAALIKDFTKYTLGAHTDSLSKFVTYLFYIPANDDLSEIGTSLYEPLVGIETDQHFNTSSTFKNFRKVKTCPFIPNSLLLFPRTNNSFHGVEEVNIEKKERNLFLLNYYIKKKN